MPNTTLRHLLDAVASRRRIAASFDTSLLAMVRLRRGSALDVVRGGGSGGGRVGCGGSGNRQDVQESVIFGSVVAKDWKAETGWHPFLRRSQVPEVEVRPGGEGGEYIVRGVPGALCSFSACACALMQGSWTRFLVLPPSPPLAKIPRTHTSTLPSCRQGPVFIYNQCTSSQWHDIAQYVTLLWGGVSKHARHY